MDTSHTTDVYIDKTQLEAMIGRLPKQGRLVFWEDESGDYRDVVPNLSLPDLAVLDVTGHELVAKRHVLRQEPHTRFLLYRAGGAPNPTEDFVLDLKLMATPFTCTKGGLWADACQVNPVLSGELERHASFFNDKSRVEALRTTPLPKGTPADLAFAMVAAILLVHDDNPHDAARSMARRLLVEWERGDQAGLRTIQAAGLADALWAVLRDHLGYTVPQGAEPTVADLAYCLLEGALGTLVPAPRIQRSAECVYVLSGLCASDATRPVLAKMARHFGADALAQVPQESRAAQALSNVDFVPQVDEEILAQLAQGVAGATINAAAVEAMRMRRVGMVWHDRYAACYDALLAMARFRDALAACKQEAPQATTASALFAAYANGWYQVDGAYRAFHTAWRKVQSPQFKVVLQDAVGAMEKTYDSLLSAQAATWQDHLLDEGAYPPPSLPAQRDFFDARVRAASPQPADGQRVGVVISDALRYEQGVELTARLNREPLGKARMTASCEPMLCMLPSYTQLGMAALLPKGQLAIDETSANVTLDGEPTQGTINRQKRLAAPSGMAGSLALKASDVLKDGLPNIKAAPAVYVYHNVIDKVGDNAETETTVFDRTSDAFEDVAYLVKTLLSAGCGTVFITSDHGFIYQDAKPGAAQFADIPGLSAAQTTGGESATRKRRFAIGTGFPTSDMAVVYDAQQLGLAGSYQVAMPRGAMRFRVQASGARFVHGGASLQEDVIPVIKVQRVVNKDAAHPAEVSLYAIGQHLISGTFVRVRLVQESPCGPGVLPTTVKIGVYAPDGKLVCAQEKQLTLASGSPNAQDRTQRIDLELTDDVDNYTSAEVRVSAKGVHTNNYKEVASIQYEVDRAWGSDF